MVKFNVKNLTITVFLGMLLFVGVIIGVDAQQTLPKGGDSFETAVKLEPGNYQGGSLEDRERKYFYIANIKPGQEIKIKGTFAAASMNYGANCILYLCDEDRVALTGTMEAPYETPEVITVSWLPNANKDSYKYYIKAGSSYNKLSSHSLDISLTDRYDAGSQTDAGDSFEKAMGITSGNYTGYLSGELGTDTKDFYRIGIKKGEKLTIKVTPPSEARFGLKMYDSNRDVVEEVFAPNPGAIIQDSLTAKKSEDFFIKVSCDGWCSKNLVNYTLNIAIQPSLEDKALIKKEVPPEEEGEEEWEITLPDEEIISLEEEPFEGGLNWALILAIIGIIIAIGVAIYFLFKRCKKGLNRITIFLFILLIISLLTGTWLYFYIFPKNDTAIYNRSSEFVYTKILKVVSIVPDLVLVVTETPKKIGKLESTGIYGFNAVLAAVKNSEETTKSNGLDFKVIKIEESYGLYKRIDALKWTLKTVNKKHLFELKWLELLFEDGYCWGKTDGNIGCKDYFWTGEGKTEKTKALIFADNFITFKHELTHHRYATDLDYFKKVKDKWNDKNNLSEESKKEIITTLISTYGYSFGIIDLKKWDKLKTDVIKKTVAEEIIGIIKKWNELDDNTKNDMVKVKKIIENNLVKSIEHRIIIKKKLNPGTLKEAVSWIIDEWNAFYNEGVFEGGIDVMQDITQQDGVRDEYWYNLLDKNGEKYFGQTYEEYIKEHPEKIRITEKQPKREEYIQEIKRDEGLSIDEYLCLYGICPSGYYLVIGERRPPGVLYECVTKRLEEATKRLEEAPENNIEATIRAIKELNEVTLLYHSRCIKRE